MKITCIGNMGYIYLQPYSDSSNTDSREDNSLSEVIDPERIVIPYSSNDHLSPLFDQMNLSTNNFRSEQGKSYETEYGNDMDKNGYLIGIELSLPQERFVELIRQQAIQVIRTSWRSQHLHLIAFDHMDNVLNPNNHIYKLTDAEDAFVVVYLERPENLGYTVSEPQLPIAIFKAFMTARDDIYPLDYWMRPEFILLEDSLIIEQELGQEPGAIDSPDSPEMRDIIDSLFGNPRVRE